MRFLGLVLLVVGCAETPLVPVFDASVDGSCSPGLQLCSSGCANTESDPRHCGSCENACGLDDSCANGMCQTRRECSGGQQDCGEGCIEVVANDQHCGRCGNSCTAPDTCRGGSCQPEMCPESRPTRCGDTCTDTGSDNANCGRCDNPCMEDQSCVDGMCRSACDAGETSCMLDDGSVCANTMTDSAHCGRCSNPCEGGQMCMEGNCVCPEGTTLCGETCVNTTTDPMNCGMCGRICDAGFGCNDSNCVCPTGLTECGGECVNTAVDNAHCGMCMNPCATPAETCAANACQSACGPGTTICSGMCVSLLDRSNCGRCGNACAMGTSCETGLCRPDNDDRTNAVALTFPIDGSEVTVAGSTTNATRDGPTVSCSANGPNVWYSFTLTEREVVWIDTAGSMYDTAVFITNASGVQQGSLCNDDCGCGSTGDFGGLQSCTAAVLLAGTYFISVGGFGPAASGDFSLHVQHLPDVGFTYSTRLQSVGTTTTTALLDTSEANGSCDGGFGARSGEDQRWFASCGGTATSEFSVCPEDGGSWTRQSGTSAYDSVMYVRSAATGTEISCNDDGVSTVNCAGTGGDSANFGSRIMGLATPRGIHGVFVDSRGLGGGGMSYRMRYTVPPLTF